jgi:signal transduction histidine kinase
VTEATAKPLLLYIQQKNGWTPLVMSYIDWGAHSSALRQRPEKRTHMTKLLNEILPTAGQANRFDRGTRRCPLCPSQMEDRDHILCCPHPTRQTWRETFLKEVANHCRNTGTAPLLQEVVLQGVQRWFSTPQEFSLSTEGYNSDIQQLIHQQNRIGWRQLFHGRYSVEWAKLQETHYRSLQRDDASSSIIKQTGERWLVNLILFVWDKWYTLWKQRNQELHGDDVLTRAAAERKEIQRQLQDIYQRRQDLEPRVQELLFADVTHHYEVPLSVTRNWLAAHTGLIGESMRRVKAKAIQGVRSIRTYFNTIR